MTRKIVSAIAVATFMAQPAFAITPPLGPPEYSAYGPLQICAADFKIDVEADEAVHIVGNVTRLLRDDYLIAAVPVILPIETLGKSISIPIILDGGQAAYRFTAPTPDPDREVLFASQALGPDDIRYAVSIPGDGDRFIIVGSTGFTGEPSDKSILGRIFSTKAKSADCLPGDVAQTLRFSSDASEETRLAREKLASQARLYPPKPDTVRNFYCLTGVGFALKPDEILHRPWNSLGEAAEATVSISSGAFVRMTRRAEPLHRVDGNDINEHPLGLLHESRIVYYPSRGVGPPYAAEGVREDGSWLIELGKYPRQKMYISFPASDKTPFGFQFLERLQFVERNDPRCTGEEGLINIKDYLTPSPVG